MSTSGLGSVAYLQMGDVAPEVVEHTSAEGVAETAVVAVAPADLAAAVAAAAVVSEMAAGWPGAGLRHQQSILEHHLPVQVSGS